MKNKRRTDHLTAAPKSEGPERTVFVCVRDRQGKGASCTGGGSRELLARMRSMLAAEQIGDRELTVRPTGCMGLCKRGPVLVTAIDEAAGEKQPRKPKKKAAGVYTRVKPKHLREILRALLARPALP